jgi:hypothetical protein
MGKLRHFFNGIPISTKEVKEKLKKNKSGE